MPPPPVFWRARNTIQAMEVEEKKKKGPEKKEYKGDIFEVGGGNLLYAEERLKENPNLKYKVTEVLSSQEAEEKWKGTKARRDWLVEKGVEVQFGVDATDLESTSSQNQWKTVVWNSPYAEGFSNNRKKDEEIVKNTEKLLHDFLESVKSKAPLEVHVGGFKWPHIDEGYNRPIVDFEELAKGTGWKLESEEPFEVPGTYAPVRTVGGEFKKSNLKMKKAKTFIFRRDDEKSVIEAPRRKFVIKPFKPPSKVTPKEGEQKNLIKPPVKTSSKLEEPNKKRKFQPSSRSEDIGGDELWGEVKELVLSYIESGLQKKGILALREEETAENYFQAFESNFRTRFRGRWNSQGDADEIAADFWKVMKESYDTD